MGRPLNRDQPPKIIDVPKGHPDHLAAPGHTLAFVRLEHGGLMAAPLYLLIVLRELGLF